jgi:hypothetical protein
MPARGLPARPEPKRGSPRMPGEAGWTRWVSESRPHHRRRVQVKAAPRTGAEARGGWVADGALSPFAKPHGCRGGRLGERGGRAVRRLWRRLDSGVRPPPPAGPPPLQATARRVSGSQEGQEGGWGTCNPPKEGGPRSEDVGPRTRPMRRAATCRQRPPPLCLPAVSRETMCRVVTERRVQAHSPPWRSKGAPSHPPAAARHTLQVSLLRSPASRWAHGAVLRPPESIPQPKPTARTPGPDRRAPPSPSAGGPSEAPERPRASTEATVQRQHPTHGNQRSQRRPRGDAVDGSGASGMGLHVGRWRQLGPPP